MSLYNIIAGRNDALIISFSVILNMRIDQEIPRFRDIFLHADDCERKDYDAIIYTRMGGSNFECWEDNKPDCTCPACKLKKMIKSYPWIVGYYDDEFDETYKNLVIKLTPEQKEIWKTIQAKGLEPFKEQVERLFPRKEQESKE